MSCTQETSVTSSEDRWTAVEAPKKLTKINGETKAESDGTKLTVEELFPWISEFKKKCRCLLAQPNIIALTRLMKYYARNVSINVNECYTKPYRAAKLKDSISEILLFFLFYYRELPEVCDRNSYLDKMSDLLAMYMDMELKASRRGREHHSKIAARLTSCLYVYLENSSEHILDTFIKAKFINRNYQEILDPVLTKISKTIPASPDCDTMYVRCLLIYRLWKKVNNDVAIKNQINATAVLHLGPPPASPTPFLAKYVLPKVPKSQATSTKFLLAHKFDIEKSCRLFVQFCKENREDENQADLDKPYFIANISNMDTLESLDSSGVCRGMIPVDNLTENVNVPEAVRAQQTSTKTNWSCGSCPGKCVSEKCEKNSKIRGAGEDLPLKPLKPVRVLPRPRTKKTGDILFIDLTADEITEKVIKKKKHRKLHWLIKAKKKLSAKTREAAERKKKTQTAANDSSRDLSLSDLVDSTSAGSISDSVSQKPLICLGSSVVSTTVAETVSAAPKKSQHIPLRAEDSLPVDPDEYPMSVITSDAKISDHSPESFCHTTSGRDKIGSVISEAVAESSNALSHICESYDSDNSNLETSRDDSVDSSSKRGGKMTGICDGAGNLDDKNMLVETRQKTSEDTERDGNLEQPGTNRSSSESSDVAVIFTRHASDVEIVDLDEYSAESSEKSGLPKPTEENVCSSTVSVTSAYTETKSHDDQIENAEASLRPSIADVPEFSDTLTSEWKNVDEDSTEAKINGDLKDITSDITVKMSLNTSKGLEDFAGTELVENDDSRETDAAGRTDTTKDENTQCVIDEKEINSDNNRVIKIVNKQIENKILITFEQQEASNVQNYSTRNTASEKLEQTELAGYNIKKHCDDESSKSKRFDVVKISLPSTPFEVAEEQRHSTAKKQTEASIVERQTLIPKMNEISICTKSNGDNIRDIPSDILTNPEPEFNENIDGLSLLASVSQHVSHLEGYSEKARSKPKIINTEVPSANSRIIDYSSEINSLCNATELKEIVNCEPREVLLDFNVSTSGEIINEIVAHQINDYNNSYEVDSQSNCDKKCSPDIGGNESLECVPRTSENTVDFESSTSYDNLISVDNVAQITKDDKNVIVNGETVVLFQKAPNSNLYIINKATDNTTECSGADDKKRTFQNIGRNSTTMRDIINYIPINLSEKNMVCQEGGKIHRSKTCATKNKMDGRKIVANDISMKNLKNQQLSKQFKPIKEEFLQNVYKLGYEHIKKEILSTHYYEDTFGPEYTDVLGSVIESKPVKKCESPVTGLTDTSNDIQMQTIEHINEDSIPINMATAGRSNRKSSGNRREDKCKGTSNENLLSKKNIKQEFESCETSLDYKNQINSDPQQVIKQNVSNIDPNNLLAPVISIPHVYSTVTTDTNSYSLEHEHCLYTACSLKLSSSQSFQSVPQTVPTCQLSHCACLKCAYEVHCQQYVQRSTAVTHSSYLHTNSYFLPNTPTTKQCTIQEQESKLNAAALAKLHDDQLLHNIEQSIIDSKKLNQSNVKSVPEIKYKQEFENKLPLKKRLKAHAMLSTSYEDTPVKIEKVENYPGTPMMSIAALEAREVPETSTSIQGQNPLLTVSVSELSPRVRDEALSHHTTEMIRRDYLKDTSLTSIGNCGSIDERGKKVDALRCQPSFHRNFKTPAQKKELIPSSPPFLKRAATTVANHPKCPKKAKKTKSATNTRQTRSSKRNIPKVDYSYDGVTDSDPKWNTSSELKRKRKKTGR